MKTNLIHIKMNKIYVSLLIKLKFSYKRDIRFHIKNYKYTIYFVFHILIIIFTFYVYLFFMTINISK